MGPSTDEVEGIGEALDGASLAPASFNVESAPNPGFGERLVIMVEVPHDAMTVDLLREILRVVYDNTATGFDSNIELSAREPELSSGRGVGDSVSLVTLVRELGLTYEPGGGNFRFQRADLEPLFG
jgi:hypothetical protein